MHGRHAQSKRLGPLLVGCDHGEAVQRQPKGKLMVATDGVLNPHVHVVYAQLHVLYQDVDEGERLHGGLCLRPSLKRL